MLRKKALQVAPEPEGSSCHLPQEQSGPFVPSGGEGVPGRARRWKRPAFWQRKPAPSAGGKGPPGTQSMRRRNGWTWPWRRLLSRTPKSSSKAKKSTMTAALEPELETHLLRAALHAVFTLGMEKDTTQVQDLHRVLPNLMDAMLGNLLVESPDSDRLHDILEPMNYWIMSRVSQERARAIRSSTALLRFTITLPELDNAAEFPRMGHHVAELALFISDPAKDMSRQARREFTGSTRCCCTRGARSEDSAHCAATNGIGRTQALQPE
ncbi:maestro heat-like repeat-containing protein family member 7 isoform X1 [Chelonia mydas]|nr:maestro heat-like repeat-containing protein family member 7 isoform X1 [Chelonia mydas]XP_043399865.1 maestro heat-like repeat-containing protein family member 7 isoform X1 [Chelonia mydas]XP_043399866.1 maestro heat-like repeat-containing protein family member 7 isoform X1 [Chelonia mydas]XP_043399867.1 maestro heat-like repeat-containing protein family member 7 isoform X1 [Chelonia mydas]XP_043399868.1 maestro heat-like repeat-containing protein family member 7 isoform X1 [Chelonia mydas]